MIPEEADSLIDGRLLRRDTERLIKALILSTWDKEIIVDTRTHWMFADNYDLVVIDDPVGTGNKIYKVRKTHETRRTKID